MDFGVLGPLRVRADGGEIDIPGQKERVLLARLAAQPGQTVPFDALADALWGLAPPANARKVLQTYVLRLRNALEPGRGGRPTVVVTDAGGYRLAVPEDSVDAVRLGTLVDEARTAAREGRHTDAVARAASALALWRGPAYAGVEEAEFADRERRRLDELRIVAEEVRWGSQVALGNHSAAVPALEALVQAHPWREPLWCSLVLALYRSGRQGDALAAYARARTTLDEDLGIEPGADLRDLHRRVLAQDPDLDLVGLDQLPPGLAEPRTPMVGRDDELAALERGWERARRGGTVVATVVGPPGSGRRRLAQAFASGVAEAGGRVHDGPASHTAGPVLHVLDDGWCDDCARTPRAMLLLLTRPGSTSYPVRPDVLVELGPLDALAARQLVGAYLPPEEAATLVTASVDRLPGALHTRARTRVRDRATESIGAATSRLAEAAAQLAHRRAEITEAAVTWEEHAPTRARQPGGDCPWRGLAAYGTDDRAWFAGREHLTAELVARVAGSRMVALVGASGSGKSSLLHAGLLGGLAEGVLPGGETWVQVVMRPGAHPMRELSRAALEAGGQDPASVGDVLERLLREDPGATPGRGARARRVLAIDQFEETWTVCQDPGERDTFLDTLVELATVGLGRTVVVLAVRADYVAHLAEHAAMARLVADNTLLVGVPTRAEIQRAVEVPAQRAGLQLDAGLAETIVDDAGTEPGLLPLLSAALTQLWQSRVGTRLGYAAYVAVGGLPGAIAHLAEQAWQELPEEHRGAAKALLLRLAGPGEGATVVRRRVAMDELVALPGAGTAGVVDRLVAARLLTVSDGTVEVAHEALFREWPRLAGWLGEDATGRAVLRRLAVAASEWDAEGREPQQLWRGTRLVSGVEVAEAYPDEVTATERDFLAASTEAVDAERRAAEEAARRTRQQNQRLRRLLTGVAGLLVVALVAGALAVWSRQEAAVARDVAASNARSAEARKLAAQAVNEEYHDLALLQAVEAVRSERSPDTVGALITTVSRAPRLVHQVRTADLFLRAGVSEDGSTVLLSENAPVLWGVDALSGQVRWKVDLDDVKLWELDGGAAGVLATGGGPEGGVVLLLDPADGQERWRVVADDVEALQDDGRADPHLQGALWTGPDTWVAVTSTHVVTGDASGGITRVVAVDHGQAGGTGPVLWPDGRVAVSQDGKGYLVDPGSDRPAEELPAEAIAVSPDGRFFLTRTWEGAGASMRVHRTADLRPAGEAFQVAVAGLAAWSPDGSTLAVGSAEAVLLRDGETGDALESLSGAHSGAALEPVYAGPNGTMLWSAGRDGVGTGWDLTGQRTAVRSAPAGGSTIWGVGDRDGRVAAALQFFFDIPHRAYLVNPVTGDLGPELTLDGCGCQPVATTVDPGGRLALAVHEFLGDEGPEPGRGLLGVWSAPDGEAMDRIDLPLRPWGVATDPDGTVAVVNGDRGYAVVDLGTGRSRPLVELEGPGFSPAVPHTVAVSRDGARAVLLRGSTVHVVDLQDGTSTARDVRLDAGEEAEELSSAVWSADGTVVVVGSLGGRLQFLDSTTLDPVATPRMTVGGFVLTLAVSPDGTVLVNTGSDGEARLWDTATWAPLGQPVLELGDWTWAAFVDGGRRVNVFTEGPYRTTSEIEADPEGAAGRVHSLPTSVEEWVAAACSQAGRELTPAEWDAIRPGQQWRPTCGDGDRHPTDAGPRPVPPTV